MVRISVSEACRRLIDEEVVAIPTETVYGLAATLEASDAVQRIFVLKQRPANNPLIIHLAEPSHLVAYAKEIPPGTDALTAHFWPGPLTLVLPVVTNRVPEQVRAGLPTAAFRIPRHELTLAILRQVGPLVAPSANLSGRPSATTVEHVEEDFGDRVPVVEGGPCTSGMESTILAYRDGLWRIARLGALSAEELEPVLGYRPALYDGSHDSSPLCPGSLYRHYAPKAKLVLGREPYTGQLSVVIGYSDRQYPGASTLLTLGPSSDPDTVAHHLYDVLRQLDRMGLSAAWVDLQVGHDGLWAVIRERLNKAAVET